jgi:hypothetical protein
MSNIGSLFENIRAIVIANSAENGISQFFAKYDLFWRKLCLTALIQSRLV